MKNNNCPFCEEGRVKMIEEQRELSIKGKLVTGIFLVYVCDSCEEKFTTTESDEQSLKNFGINDYNETDKDN